MTEKELISSAVKKEKVRNMFNRTVCALLLTVYSLQCCGSGMFIPVPGSRFFSIPDPTTKKRKGKKLVILPN
jgi:hypothetical protein